VSLTLLAGVVLLHGTLLDGTGSPPVRDAFVEIEDGRIARVGMASSYRTNADDEIVDLAGRWIVPGYIDTHVHLFDSGSLYTSPDDYDLTRFVPHEEERRRIEARIDETLERFLCAGVTTLASLGGPRWELDVARRSKAPKVVAAGPFLAAFPVGDLTLWTRGDPVLVTIATPDEARAAVRDLAVRGVPMVKAGYAGPSPEALAPVIEALSGEARARGLRIAMHAEELETARMALRAGVQVLAHTVVDRRVDDELVALAKQKEVVWLSGLSHFGSYRAVLDGSFRLLPIESRCGDPEVIATWDDLDTIPEAQRPEVPASIRWGSSAEGRRILLANVRRMHEAGVPVAIGTNGGNIGTLQGPAFHRELRLLSEAGIPAADLLVAATRNGALALGLLKERGTIEAGKAADVVVLAADPIAAIENFAAIERVYVSGREVTRVPPRSRY
jgi:imidazolonepropionase-like amidohydrolase